MTKEDLEEKIRSSIQELGTRTELGEKDQGLCEALSQNFNITSEQQMEELEGLVYRAYFILEKKALLAEVLYLVTLIDFTLDWNGCQSIEAIVLLYGYCLLKYEFNTEVQRIKTKEKQLYHLMDDKLEYQSEREIFMEKLVQKKVYYEQKEEVNQDGQSLDVLMKYWKKLLLLVIFSDIFPEEEGAVFWNEASLTEDKIRGKTG